MIKVNYFISLFYCPHHPFCYCCCYYRLRGRETEMKKGRTREWCFPNVCNNSDWARLKCQGRDQAEAGSKARTPRLPLEWQGPNVSPHLPSSRGHTSPDPIQSGSGIQSVAVALFMVRSLPYSLMIPPAVNVCLVSKNLLLDRIVLCIMFSLFFQFCFYLLLWYEIYFLVFF